MRNSIQQPVIAGRKVLIDGAGNRIRTRDPLITNQVLYQLSYAGAAC